jgi:hypothetical protein
MRQSNDERSVPYNLILRSGIVRLSELRRRMFIAIGEHFCMFMDSR